VVLENTKNIFFIFSICIFHTQILGILEKCSEIYRKIIKRRIKGRGLGGTYGSLKITLYDKHTQTPP